MSLSKHQKTGPIYYIWLTLVDRNFLFFLNREKRCSVLFESVIPQISLKGAVSDHFHSQQRQPCRAPLPDGPSPAKAELQHLPEPRKPGKSPRRDSWTPENKVLFPRDGPLKTPTSASTQEPCCALETPQHGVLSQKTVQEVTLSRTGYQICLKPQAV